MAGMLTLPDPIKVDFIRTGVRSLATNSDIAFKRAEGSRVTGELRKATA